MPEIQCRLANVQNRQQTSRYYTAIYFVKIIQPDEAPTHCNV